MAELSEIVEEAHKEFALKNYEKAVELYGDSCQLYNKLNGEDDPSLLYLYGKSLFELAVSKNGLFGGNDQDAAVVAGKDDEKKKEELEIVPLAEEVESEDEEEVKEENDNAKEGGKVKEVDDNAEKEDEWEDEPEGEDNNNEKEEQGEEEQSDFEIAWEILDLSRSIIEKKLSKFPSEELIIKEKPTEEYLKSIDSTKEDSTVPNKTKILKLKLKLLDVYDLLGEISLETENFKQSVEDFKTLLDLRNELYEFSSNLISEANYKLALSYEFYFDNDNESLNEANKKKSIHHLKESIKSLEANRQIKLSKNESFDNDVLTELKNKLKDLEKDPNEEFNKQKNEILKGILGEATSSSQETGKIAPKTSQVNDLTSMVKKRKPKPLENEKTKK